MDRRRDSVSSTSSSDSFHTREHPELLKKWVDASCIELKRHLTNLSLAEFTEAALSPLSTCCADKRTTYSAINLEANHFNQSVSLQDSEELARNFSEPLLSAQPPPTLAHRDSAAPGPEAAGRRPHDDSEWPALEPAVLAALRAPALLESAAFDALRHTPDELAVIALNIFLEVRARLRADPPNHHSLPHRAP